MAANKLTAQTQVQPKDFSYLAGDWTQPTQDHQPAFLLDATTVEAATAIAVPDTSKDLKVNVSFALSKRTDNYGWGPKSGLSIRAKLGENGKSQQQPINQEYVDLATNQASTFHQVFTLDGNHQTNDGKLHFALVDDTEDVKGGLLLRGATVNLL